jgi:hypothetical protein
MTRTLKFLKYTGNACAILLAVWGVGHELVTGDFMWSAFACGLAGFIFEF